MGAQAHTTKVKTFKITTYERIVKESMRFWMIGVGFSIASGVYSRRALGNQLSRAKATGSSPEKESEVRTQYASVKA
jgi:peroxin-11B